MPKSKATSIIEVGGVSLTKVLEISSLQALSISISNCWFYDQGPSSSSIRRSSRIRQSKLTERVPNDENFSSATKQGALPTRQRERKRTQTTAEAEQGATTLKGNAEKRAPTTVRAKSAAPKS